MAMVPPEFSVTAPPPVEPMSIDLVDVGVREEVARSSSGEFDAAYKDRVRFED
jgi:hypothetical protein